VHPLVARQLRKAGLEAPDADPRLAKFVAAVSEAYVAADQDRRQLEHSLNLASEELHGRNRRLEAELVRRAAMERELADAARRDRLTGLASRAYFLEKLERGVARIADGTQSLLAVLYMDFDRFKFVNDTLGHEAGDDLLLQIAARLRGEFGDGDGVTGAAPQVIVSRFGGDEFLLLLNDIHEPGEAVRVADRLLEVLAPTYRIRGREVHSTASIGVVTSDQCPVEADELVRNADVAMYEAKRAGRGRRVVFDRSMRTRLARRVAIEHALRHAVDRGEMRLAFQPIVELATGLATSAEALVRWTHPTLGDVRPAEFVPIAEETGLIVAIGEWVQREACETLKHWRTTDPEHAPETISVNVSRTELALGPRMLEQVRATLERTGLAPHRLQLEITEREIMRDPDVARNLLRALGDLGVKIAMDDFGTGNSSLGFLRNYPFDTIKIDRSFVQDLTASPDGLAVLHAAVTLIENLGMTSVVEGVEELGQVAVLQSLGCRAAQGHWFGYPVPGDQYLAILAARRPFLRRTG
jgi:diguanylate cyclase (GGDEF)-like protein